MPRLKARLSQGTSSPFRVEKRTKSRVYGVRTVREGKRVRKYKTSMTLKQYSTGRY
jgi:hypothetical protein